MFCTCIIVKLIFFVVFSMIQGQNKVRVLNLANSRMRKFKYDDLEKMTNLHYLILDGCDVSGNICCISRELRWLQWRNMPLTHIPHMLDFSNLVALDFSYSTYLANVWIESNPALEVSFSLCRIWICLNLYVEYGFVHSLKNTIYRKNKKYYHFRMIYYSFFNLVVYYNISL